MSGPSTSTHAATTGVFGVLLWAVLLRIPLQFGPPHLSDDIYRYLWEGHVVVSGGDPFDLSPLAPTLEYLRSEVPAWELINHPNLPAIYPPGAQWFFAALDRFGFGLIGFRATFVLFEIGLFGLLGILLLRRGQSVEALILGAWNPLFLLEVSHSGHFEPLAMAPMVIGLFLLSETGSRISAGVGAWMAFGLGLSLKFAGAVPALFVGLRLLRNGDWRRLFWGLGLLFAVPALLALPFAWDGQPPLGSLLHYAQHWGHNATVHAALTPFFGYHPSRWICLAGLSVFVLFLIRRDVEPVRGALLLFAGVLVFSPIVHPWYGLWIVVLLPLCPSLPLLLFAGLLPLSYLGRFGEVGSSMPLWVQPVEAFIPALVAVVLAWDLRRQQRGSGRPRPSGGS